MFAIRWFFKDVKIRKEDVNKDYKDDPQVIIEFILENDEDIPIFDDEYCVEGNKFYVRGFRSEKDISKGSQFAGHELNKNGKEPKKLSTPKMIKLVDLIFVPSIRELNDEFKFTANSTINKLVTKYVVERVEEEEKKTQKYKQIKKSIESLSEYIGRGETSAFELLKKSLKDYMLDYGNVEINFELTPPEISQLITGSFEASVKIGDDKLPLDSQGMGFQRSLIFSLLCNIADIEKDPSGLTLYLIEEPELFLHPNHQNHFKNKLIDLSVKKNNQIVLTSHSPYFLNNIQKEKYSQVKRVFMDKNRVSVVKEITEEDVSDICQKNGDLMVEAKDVCRGISFTEEEFKKESAKIAADDELRYLLWIDPNRANAFLSKKVILVEGPSEKAFFSFIFDNTNGTFYKYNKTSEIMVLDTVGKFHLYKFANLLFKLGIPTWIVYDGDNDKTSGRKNDKISHKKLNEYIVQMNDENIVVDVFEVDSSIESFLDIDKDNNPDIAIYQKLINNENGCRDCDNFNTLMEFVESIIEHEV